MRHLPLVLAILLPTGLPRANAAQEPIRLGEPAGRAPESFSRVAGLRELPDGRVLVSDNRERVVRVVDFQAGRMTTVGREGAGPREYAAPGALFALPQGRSIMVDGRNQRFLYFGPDGQPTETTPILRLSGGQGVSLGLGAPGGVDAQGRLYFAMQAFGGGGAPPDSIPILRWTPGTERVDTVGVIRNPTAGAPVATRTAGTGASFSMQTPVVYRAQEQWGITPDGTLIRVMPDPYRLVVQRAGQPARPGAVIPYTPIPVTDADRQAYRQTQAAAPRPQITTSGPEGTRTFSPDLPEPTFEPTKPAFWGTGSVVVAPTGETWVLRTRPANDRVPTYDVFDATGNRVRRIALPPGGRLVGFGARHLYVAVTDEDELEELRRYPLNP